MPHQIFISQGHLVEAGDAGPALGGEENAQGGSEATSTSVQVAITIVGQTKRSSSCLLISGSIFTSLDREKACQFRGQHITLGECFYDGKICQTSICAKQDKGQPQDIQQVERCHKPADLQSP